MTYQRLPLPIFIERVSDRLRHHYRRQERFDSGEMQERRVENTLRPRSGEVTPSVQEFCDWLDAEDFGNDPERIRREAWRG